MRISLIFIFIFEALTIWGMFSSPEMIPRPLYIGIPFLLLVPVLVFLMIIGVGKEFVKRNDDE